MGNVVVSGGLYALGFTTVTCRANDTALNEGSCLFNITVVDNEAPTLTCPSDVPSMNVDPGTASSNVTWSAPPSANDIVDGDVTANVVCTDDTGNVVVSGGLYALGLTTVTCRANDTALNEGSCQFNITVVDNEAPTVTCPSVVPSMNVDPGTASSNVTWSTPPTANDIVDGDVTANVVCTDDMGNVVVSGDLYAVGLTTVTCRANDTALNEGSCLLNITVDDNEAPSVTCPSDVPSINVDPGTTSSNVTWSAPPSANDIVDGDVTANVVCTDDMGNVVVSGGLYALGLTTVTCTANDTALNEGSCLFNITVVDNEAPSVTCPSDVPSINVDPGTASSNVTWSAPPSANDIVDGDVTANVVCTDDTGNVVVSGDLYALGLTTVTCTANDTALNEGSCLFNITVVDDEAPTLTCPSDVPSMNVDPGTASSNVTWSAPPSATDIVDGDVTANVVCTDDMGNVVVSGGLYAVGLTTVTCRANDTALNEGSCQFNITVVDNEAPSVTCPSDVPSMNVDPGTASSNVTWSAPPSANDIVDGDVTANVVCTDDMGNVVVSGDLYAVGLTTVTCRANDTALNEGSCLFNITVDDNETPSVTCPSDVPSMNVDPGTTSSNVTWSAPPSANDIVDGDVTANVVCKDDTGNVVVSGDLYALGLTTVTCRANDTALNEGSCQFNITVDDNEAPTVTCPSDVPSMNVDPGTASSNVTWSAPPSANDIVDGDVTANVVCKDDLGNVVESGDLYAVGLTAVTCRANDTALNEGSCQFNITVVDNEGPIVTCPSNESLTNVMSGTDMAQIVWSALPSANDIVEGAIGANAITCEDGNSMTVTSGDSYKIGITTVTCTASDSAMNQGSCQFDITVECELSASNCSNGGTFDPSFCECLCQEDYSGETCDNFNPCTVDTSLCTIETGQYCVANDSIVAGYTCECRDYDGFVETADGSCEETPTLKVAGIKINAPFTLGLRNRRSRAFRRMSRFFIRAMRRLFRTRHATRNFLFFSILGFRSGSVVADMSASFPSNSTLPNVTDIMDTLANATISDGVMNFTIDVSDLAVEDIDSCMAAPCLNGGTCNNTIANFTCTCAPGFGGETCEIDIEAPVVSCPMSAPPVNVVPGTASNVVWFTLPTASDNVDVNITDSAVCEDDLGNVVISGGTYTAGLTLVTCKVLDSDMNEGSCQFNISVVDNEAPTIACPDNPALAQLGIQTSGVAVVWTPLPSANDTVDGILTPACLDDSGNQVASGDDFGVGLTTIICTAQDAASNEATCNFNITIECVLSAVNCSNGGTFSADFCECLCPSNYTGDTCEDLSPCLVNSSLCSSEVGTTCIASGNSYTCECNSWDGYFRQNGSCIKLPTLLLQFTAPTLTFISAYGNTQSAAFSTLAAQMEILVLASLQSSPATAEALAARVLSFAAGSVVTNAAVSFPSNSSLPNATAVASALTPAISDGNTSIPITGNSTSSQDADDCNSNPCQNGATCTNTMEGFDCACVLGFNGTTCDMKFQI
ncbi:hyalin-like [Asterias rubens]|uniref:hyalin-like n=1 Tax=Asterias rubens TaxID=7604 RepID=UPI001455657A|nr:hyalin-like [Asterias rubens]